jgi:hypothetical protein
VYTILLTSTKWFRSNLQGFAAGMAPLFVGCVMWILCSEKMPGAGMECVVLVQYDEDEEPFTAITKYELQTEDSLDREISEAEYEYGWNDFFDCDVVAWFQIPDHSGIKKPVE